MSSTAVASPSKVGVKRKLPPLRIVAVGDSLIYGFGDPIGGGWVERLRSQWMSPSGPAHALYNLGIRGDGVAQVQGRLAQEFRRRGEFHNRQPDLILLSVGINDTPRVGRLDGRNLMEFERFQASLSALLEQSRQLAPVLFVGMVPVEESRMPFLNCLYYNHADQCRYHLATQRACQDRQIPYLNLFDLWMGRGDHWRRDHLGPDGLHPNVRGYQALLKDVGHWEPLSNWF
ncbi:MAG: GDSL-type esterase/lipase family protein [Xenococcaceae cyanobacterium]